MMLDAAMADASEFDVTMVDASEVDVTMIDASELDVTTIDCTMPKAKKIFDIRRHQGKTRLGGIYHLVDIKDFILTQGKVLLLWNLLFLSSKVEYLSNWMPLGVSMKKQEICHVLNQMTLFTMMQCLFVTNLTIIPQLLTKRWSITPGYSHNPHLSHSTTKVTLIPIQASSCISIEEITNMN